MLSYLSPHHLPVRAALLLFPSARGVIERVFAVFMT